MQNESFEIRCLLDTLYFEENRYNAPKEMFKLILSHVFDKKIKSHPFKKFDTTIDLSRQKDPIRSWTLRDYKDSRWIINGLCILQPHYLLEIRL